MKTAAYRVHRLIQDLARDGEKAGQFAADMEPFFEAYELAEQEKQLLRSGSREDMIELGIHPNLQMKYMRVSKPPRPAGPSPLQPYLKKLGLE